MTEFVIIAFTFSIISLLLGIHAIIEIKAMQKSTHKVTFFNPASQEFSNLTDEQREKLTKDPFDDNI